MRENDQRMRAGQGWRIFACFDPQTAYAHFSFIGYPMKLGGPCASSTLRSGSRLKPACDVGAAAVDAVPTSVKTRLPCAPAGAMTAVHYGIVFSAFSGRW